MQRKADSRQLNRHRPDFLFHLSCIHHRDGVPRAAIEEAAVRTLAQALLAADTKNGVDCDAAEWRMVLVGHPKHAVFDRTIFDARGRAGASRAALRDHRQFLRLLLSRGGEAFRLRFKLLLVGNHSNGFSGAGCRRHARDYNAKAVNSQLSAVSLG